MTSTERQPDLKHDGARIFGSPTRTAVLVLIAALGESYPEELARLIGAQRSSVQRIVADLESDGLVASRLSGNTRRVAIDRRRHGAAELETYLRKLAERPAFSTIIVADRRRPRRRAKPL
jgi:DNA-binding transcriptional ArsR family regulator